MTIKQHLRRDLCWLPLLGAFLYVCELTRERLAPGVPVLIVAVLAALVANQLRSGVATPTEGAR